VVTYLFCVQVHFWGKIQAEIYRSDI
jgi:hypothetical protein